MNRLQKDIVAVAATVATAMLFFPPFQYGSSFGLSEGSAGYGFIGARQLGSISWALLLVQWAAVAFLAGVFYRISSSQE